MSSVGTAFQNMLLKKRQKEGQKWQGDKEEDVGSYWITLRKRENNKPFSIGSTRSQCGEQGLEEAVDDVKMTCMLLPNLHVQQTVDILCTSSYKEPSGIR